MNYISTRGRSQPLTFRDVLLGGLMDDGGLALPDHYPQLGDAELTALRPLGYADLAFEIISRFATDIPAADLRRIVDATYTPAVYAHARPGSDAGRITPLTAIGDGLFLQELSNGPTLAFKDMAMQLLGNLFEYELAARGEQLNILGATSGDTGSAAEYAMRGKQGVSVFMLSPHGRMSAFQQAQMYSLTDANIHNLAVEGVFDDAQDIVKAVSNDLEFKRRWRIGTVNSINWARLMAQVVYYFAGYFQATTANDQKVSFAVPSGNFGNVCAGHVARMMGLPIHRLVVATNENDVLDEFFRSGVYRVRDHAHETSSPSMDISRASNFERFVFDLLARDGQRTAELFGAGLARDGGFTLAATERERIGGYGFVSGRSSHADRLATIRGLFEATAVLIDPHTADGLKVAREHLSTGVPMIVLETAQPAKFAATIHEAIATDPGRPAAFTDIESLPRRCTVIAPDVDRVKTYIAEHATR